MRLTSRVMVRMPSGWEKQFCILSAVAFLVSISVLAGCESAKVPANLPSPKTSNSTSTPDSDAGIPDDTSLRVEDYLSAGIPPDDRIWYADDMQQAQQSLVQLARPGFEKLPRHRSSRSGPVFARIVSPENLAPFRNTNQPVHARIQDAQGYGQNLALILILYTTAFQEKTVADSEIVELMGATLRWAVVMCELNVAFLPMLNPDDSTYGSRMQGLATMKNGMAKVIGGSLDMLNEDNNYRVSQRVRLLDHMNETFPLLFPHLLPDTQRTATDRIRQLQDAFPDQVLRLKLSHLYEQIHALNEQSE